MGRGRTFTHRLGQAAVLRAALHVEGLDLSREAAEEDGLVDGVRHLPLWGLRNVLWSTSPLD